MQTVQNLLYQLSSLAVSHYLCFLPTHAYVLFYFLFSVSVGCLTLSYPAFMLSFIYIILMLQCYWNKALTGPPILHITTWVVYIIKMLPGSALYSLCISGPFWLCPFLVCACVSVGEGISYIQGPLVVLMCWCQCRTTVSAVLELL